MGRRINLIKYLSETAGNPWALLTAAESTHDELELERFRELLQRFGRNPRPLGPQIAGPLTVQGILPCAGNLEVEHFWAFLVNTRNEVIETLEVAQGGVSSVSLTPADILRGAIRVGASGLLIAHNHPSGSPEPSTDDDRLTVAVAKACRAVGLKLLDHVILSAGGTYSYRVSKAGLL